MRAATGRRAPDSDARAGRRVALERAEDARVAESAALVDDGSPPPTAPGATEEALGTDLFVYGSLLFEDVFRAVTGVDAPSAPAALEGFARYRIRDATYPAMVPEPGARTEGRVYEGLDADAVRALDRFEGEMYTRERVEVVLADGRRSAVETYVFVEALRDLLAPEPWHPEVHGAAARAELGPGDDEAP